MESWEYLFNQLVVDMSDVVIVSKSLFNLLFRDYSCVASINGSKRISHILKINIHIPRNIVYDEF